MKLKLVMDRDGNPEIHIQPCKLTDGRTKMFTSNPALKSKAERLEDVTARATTWVFKEEQKRNAASEPGKEG